MLPAGSTKESRKRRLEHASGRLDEGESEALDLLATAETAAAAATSAAAEAATAASTATTGSWAALTARTATGNNRLARKQAFTLQFLAGQLASATNGFRLFASLLLGRLLKMSAELHLAENALALQLFLERLECLIDIVVANENLQAVDSSNELLKLKQ